MVFSSLTFLYIFLPLNLLIYFAVKSQKLKNWVLIIFSLAFYSYGEPIWVSLLLFSATVDFINGKVIEKNRDNWKSKAALLNSVVVNLSLLGFFKYWGFLVDNYNFIFNNNLPYKEFMLPIGISFYTFQTLSYTIDVYRGDVSAQKSYHKFLLFVSLFHQLVAGPIVRYKDIAEEIENRTTNLKKFSYGVNRFIQGLAKKVLIANTAGEISMHFLEGGFENLTVASSWLGIIMFSFQIYFDFSGYSDMAIGLGRMVGFTYKENFNYPYISKSATEFWRRWHISLGSFFRDYIYIPLGGNRKKFIRNLLAVWFLTGLWHGSSWNFVLWGLFYGVLILIEKKFLLNILEKIPNFFSHVYLLLAAVFGWVLFYFTDVTQGIEFMKIMVGLTPHELYNAEFTIYLTNNIYFILLAALVSTPIPKMVFNKIKSYILDKKRETEVIFELINAGVVLTVILLATILLVGDTYNPFLYFRF